MLIGSSKVAKIIIKVKRTADFDKLYDDFQDEINKKYGSRKPGDERFPIKDKDSAASQETKDKDVDTEVEKAPDADAEDNDQRSSSESNESDINEDGDNPENNTKKQ